MQSMLIVNLLFIAQILYCCRPRKYSIMSREHFGLNSCRISDHLAASLFKSNTVSTSPNRTKFVKFSDCTELTWWACSATNGTGWISFDPWALTSNELVFVVSELLFFTVETFWIGELSPKICTANSSTMNAVRVSNPDIMEQFLDYRNRNEAESIILKISLRLKIRLEGTII